MNKHYQSTFLNTFLVWIDAFKIYVKHLLNFMKTVLDLQQSYLQTPTVTKTSCMSENGHQLYLHHIFIGFDLLYLISKVSF